MKYLITRCTVYDMAGWAMIQGADIGLRQLDPGMQFKILVHPEHDNPLSPWPTTASANMGIEWADVVLDIGGLCQGADPERLSYINKCREKGIPYIYMAQSFFKPDPAIVRGIPAVARGKRSAEHYFQATGKLIPLASDLSFLLKPKPWVGEKFVSGYTTDYTKPWQKMKLTGNAVQLIWKPDRGSNVYEPRVCVGVPEIYGLPDVLFGAIASLKRLSSSRYHPGVAAILGKIPVEFFVNEYTKYEDLLDLSGLESDKLRDLAMVSCHYVMGVLSGAVKGS